MLLFILVFGIIVALATYIMTRLDTRQKYRRELWDMVASMRAENLKTMEFRQNVLDAIILSDLKD